MDNEGRFTSESRDTVYSTDDIVPLTSFCKSFVDNINQEIGTEYKTIDPSILAALQTMKSQLTSSAVSINNVKPDAAVDPTKRIIAEGEANQAKTRYIFENTPYQIGASLRGFATFDSANMVFTVQKDINDEYYANLQYGRDITLLIGYTLQPGVYSTADLIKNVLYTVPTIVYYVNFDESKKTNINLLLVWSRADDGPNTNIYKYTLSQQLDLTYVYSAVDNTMNFKLTFKGNNLMRLFNYRNKPCLWESLGFQFSSDGFLPTNFAFGTLNQTIMTANCPALDAFDFVTIHPRSMYNYEQWAGYLFFNATEKYTLIDNGFKPTIYQKERALNWIAGGGGITFTTPFLQPLKAQLQFQVRLRVAYHLGAWKTSGVFVPDLPPILSSGATVTIRHFIEIKDQNETVVADIPAGNAFVFSVLDCRRCRRLRVNELVIFTIPSGTNFTQLKFIPKLVVDGSQLKHLYQNDQSEYASVLLTDNNNLLLEVIQLP